MPEKSSVTSLVERGDVRGLIDRLHLEEPPRPAKPPRAAEPGIRALLDKLDQKIAVVGRDRIEACTGLQALGDRAVPALIEDLGTKDRHAAALVELALAGIGAPALPALVEVIRSGHEDRVLAAGLAVNEIRVKGLLPDDIVATLVAVMNSAELNLSRRTAAATALGQGSSFVTRFRQEIDALRAATGPQVSAARAMPSPAATPPAGQAPCKKCGRPTKTSDWTCPYCGYTQWGMIVGTGIFSLLCLGAAILWAPRVENSWWRSGVMWGGGAVGAICLLATISFVITGLRTPKKPLPQHGPAFVPEPLPEPVVASVSTPTLASTAGGTPSPAAAPPRQQVPSTAWTAEFVLDAVRRALASLPLTEVQARPAIRMSVDGLTPADFHAAVERLMSAGCVDVAGMDFPPSRPGLSIDTGQMYLSDPDDPRLSLIIAGTGDKRLVKGSSESFVLTAVDLAIDLVRSLKTPLKKDRTAVALHVVPSDVDAVLKALEGTTGRPPGHGFALGACFAADRTEQSRGYPNAPHIEVE